MKKDYLIKPVALKIALGLVFFLFQIAPLLAQTNEYVFTGKVTDNNGNLPLPGLPFS